MFLSGALPSAFFWMVLKRAPDSPRYLVMAGREEEARPSSRAGFCPRRSLPSWPRSAKAWPTGRRDGWSCAGPRFGARLRSASRSRSCVHVSGINTVIDYAPQIIQSAGWAVDVALFSTFGIGVTNLLFTLVSFRVIDKHGRKPPYILGSLGMAAALVGLMVAAATGHFTGGLVLSLILLYIACFASCIGPVFWTLVPEIFPNRVRGEAMTVPVLTQWVANAVVVLLFPLAFQQAGKVATFGLLARWRSLQAVVHLALCPRDPGPVA